jgi:hypothetical protein
MSFLTRPSEDTQDFDHVLDLTIPFISARRGGMEYDFLGRRTRARHAATARQQIASLQVW